MTSNLERREYQVQNLSKLSTHGTQQAAKHTNTGYHPRNLTSGWAPITHGVAEGATRIDAVALEPVPAARVEPRGLAVPELAIRPLQPKPHGKQRENPINHQTNQRPPTVAPTAACRW
jgi:hypothetical protein